jgi:hypothetical protein
MPLFTLLLACCWLQTVMAIELESLTLGFHEDGADPVRLLEDGYSRAQDDYLTFSLFADASLTGERQIRLVTRLHLLTDREAAERLDLGLFKASFSLSASRHEIRPILGVLALGDLGGQEIQNTYHRLGNHPVLDFASTETNQLGVLTGLSFHLAADELPFQLVAELLTDHKGCYRRSSLLVERSGAISNGRFAWRVQVGAKATGSNSDLIARALGSGPWAGLDLAWQLGEKLSLCSWIRPGASRSDQSLMGLALAFGRAGMPEGPF